ncbi:hypothetical protein pb186bvf_009411 [Paramecium bursaria]
MTKNTSNQLFYTFKQSQNILQKNGYYFGLCKYLSSMIIFTIDSIYFSSLLQFPLFYNFIFMYFQRTSGESPFRGEISIQRRNLLQFKCLTNQLQKILTNIINLLNFQFCIMKFRVIKSNKKTTQIEIETPMLEQIQEILKNIQKDKPKAKRYRKNITIFNRKVAPFFMNQFRKHLDNNQQQKEVLKYLDDLKINKKSKQKKYELGDLVNIFKDPSQTIIQDSWVSFLQNHAYQAVIDHPKLQQESREQYLSEINPLIEQVYQKQPYKLYLSREQRISQGLQENQSFEDSSQTRILNQSSDFIYTFSSDITDYIA